MACASLLVALGMLLCGCALAQGEHALQADAARVMAAPDDEGAYVPGQLIVGLGESVALPDDAAALASRVADGGGCVASSVLFEGGEHEGALLLVEADAAHQVGDGLARLMRAIASMPGVDFVQPNYRYASADVKACEATGDEDAGEQRYLDSWGDAHGANVAAAWRLVEPSRTVDVAVLDTGVYSMAEYDADSELVAANPLNYHQEFDAANLDMEHGVDVVHSGGGADAVLLPLVNDDNPTGDDHGHGTHVAAIIAANSQAAGAEPLGMAGVSPCARVVPVKVLDESGEGETANFIRAYEYLLNLADDGAHNLRVINMSFSLTFADERDEEGGVAEDDEDAAFERLINAARDKGIVTVCAAGNEGMRTASKTYPSDYLASVSVTALEHDGAVAEYSNVNQCKDISAPGTDIYSAWGSQADAYAPMSGTSQATAIVSGVMSMLWAAAPDLSVAQAKGAIYTTAHEVTGDAMAQSLNGQALAGGEGASGDASTLSAVALGTVPDGSHGAIDAAAALESVRSGKRIDWVDKDAEVIDGAGGGKTGAGESAGSKTASSPAPVFSATKIKKLKPGKRSFTVTWVRQKSGNPGYQIRYSAKKNMKGAKTRMVAKNAKTKLTVKKLKSGKRYYVQVRTFKRVKGKAYASAWSAAKQVKAR